MRLLFISIVLSANQGERLGNASIPTTSHSDTPLHPHPEQKLESTTVSLLFPFKQLLMQDRVVRVPSYAILFL